MWLANDKFKEFREAVLKGQPGRLLKIFTEIFHPENQTAKGLTACPQCQKPLERKMHPYWEYFVHACPDRHGAWMSPDVSIKVRDLFSSQITQSSQKRKVFQMFRNLVGILGVIVLVNQGPGFLKQTWIEYNESQMGPGYWPSYNFKPMPVLSEANTGIKSASERHYLADIGKLLEAGAANRINLERVLKVPRPAENYEGAFKVYRKKHQNLLVKIRSLYVPENLDTFHAAIQNAAEAQLAFYGAFTEHKIKNPKADFSQWEKHPALQTCSQELLIAYDALIKQYPNMDNAANQALESRLSWFDIS